MVHTFTFDEDMDQIWAQCYDLVVSHRNATGCATALVKPWHLALQLLFGDLTKENDPRLYTDAPSLSVSQTLELPLFWTAISRVSIIPNQLDVHFSTSMGKVNARYAQQLVGQAFWKNVEETSTVADPPASSDEDDFILSSATQSTEAVLVQAGRISGDYGSHYIASQHVLLALLQDDAIRNVLDQQKNLNVDALPDAIRKLRPMRVSIHMRPPLFPFLNEWATDLTQTVLNKKKHSEPIDPLIGRTAELRRLIAILSKYKKNSAVLLGDPGVGKTAIAEGLAHRIVNSEVPESVVARVFSLDLTSILASTQCKSAYEQIVTDILKEVAEHNMRGTRAILFFDNLSQITIGGYQADGSGLDAASIMKRFFASGELRCVGCSTVEDFRDHIEKDGALARRFSPVFVCESSSDEATEILQGLKHTLERFHNVKITDAAFKAASCIATRHFSHKRLPDAALDLIDEACVSVSLSRFRASEKVWKLQRRKVVIEIEVRSLERQLDEESERLLEDMRYELYRLEEKIKDSTSLKRYCRRLRQDLKISNERKEVALSKLRIRQAGKALQGLLVDEIDALDEKGEEIKRMLAAAESGEMKEAPDEAEDVHEADPVTVKEVAVTASYYTFIPAAKGSDVADITNLDATLEGVVVGQPTAIDVVSGVMRTLWAGLKNPRRPAATILFGGPSGTGKTLLVKELAKIAMRQSGRLIAINASDYTMPHNITRLIGTPTCTGFDQGGQLTECVRRKPFSVVYIKEIERGCDEFRMFIQTILDEGIARDGDGQVVNFSNCIIIMTTALGRTNVPNSNVRDKVEVQFKHFDREIRKNLPGEFLTRIDSTVIFRPVTGDTLMAMVDARLEELRRQLATIQLKLSISDPSRRRIRSLVVQNSVRTAQHMERWIRSQVIQPLTMILLTTDPPKHAVVVLDIDDDNELSVKVVEGGESVPPSPASSYHSFGSVDDDAALSDVESVTSEDEVGRSTSCARPEPVSVFRPPVLQVQPQRVIL